MAKTEGALFSERAKGTLARLITYQGRGSYRHAHKKLVRKDRNTAAQRGRRSLFTAAIAGWQGLTAPQKAEYNARGVPLKLPGYNLYISEHMVVISVHALFGENAKFGENIKFGSG